MSASATAAEGTTLIQWSSTSQQTVSSDLTGLLKRWSDGDQSALEQLVPVVYSELKRLARSYLAQEDPGHTLQSTALVHEAYMRLIRQDSVEWQNRAHFFGIAAQTMRRILVEHARRRNAVKRGGGKAEAELDESSASVLGVNVDILLLDSALEELAHMDPRRARVVEMRFFGGLTEAEIAVVLGVSEPTVRRDWSIAKAWLYRKMTGASREKTNPAGN